MISKTKKSIQEDFQLLIQKQIIKPRQRNQFTKDTRFVDEFQMKKKKYRKTNFLIIQQCIPQALQNNNVYRLNSNIQFPRNADSCYQLGNLNIDFYSYNYKINRIDRRNNLTSITYDPIDRPYIPIETVQAMMQKDDQRLLHSFNQLNEKKLNKQKFQFLTKQELLDFENSILEKSFIGIISKVEDKGIVTLHRIVNDQYLACLGIDHEMLQHFGQETGTIPIPFYFAGNEYNSQHLSNFFHLNTYDHKVHELQATNYRGEKFPAKILFHNYHYFDEDEQCLYEYLFFIWEVDRRWRSKLKVLENHKDYFNLKDLPIATCPKNEQQDEKRCGYKEFYFEHSRSY